MVMLPILIYLLNELNTKANFNCMEDITTLNINIALL